MKKQYTHSLDYWVKDYWNAWAGQEMLLKTITDNSDKKAISEYPIKKIADYIASQPQARQCPSLPHDFNKKIDDLTLRYNSLLKQKPVPINDLKKVVQQAKKEIYSVSF